MIKQSPSRSAGPLPRGWNLPIVILTTALLLYLPFRSISLDDFDSYSFALALEDFDLTLQQPQPPGISHWHAHSTRYRPAGLQR